jgi:hypothetical protein
VWNLVSFVMKWAPLGSLLPSYVETQILGLFEGLDSASSFPVGLRIPLLNSFLNILKYNPIRHLP